VPLILGDPQSFPERVGLGALPALPIAI